MPDKVIHEMISAYSIGCMDKENYINFKDYIDAGGELPYRELGEFQNLIAMIPLILELELPDIKLKDTVAKKLIGMQDEIKAKMKEKLTKATGMKTGSTQPPPTQQVKKANLTKEYITESFERSSQKKAEQKTVKPAVARTGSSWSLWIAFIVVVVLLLGTVFYFKSLNSSLNDDLTNLRSQITDLQDEISSNREFLSNYNSLIEFFIYKDIVVIDLSPADENSNAWGKLFIAYGQLKALLELNNVPALSPDESFQLWIVSKGVSYSLGIFKPAMNQRYFEIPQLPYLSKEELELARLTVEPRDGSEAPQGRTELFGVIAEQPTRRRR